MIIVHSALGLDKVSTEFRQRLLIVGLIKR